MGVDNLFEGFYVLCLILCLIVPLYRFYSYKKGCSSSLEGKHVVITGGSSGIGKSLACEAAKRGANVTIIARNETRLQEAMQEILHVCKFPNQRVFIVSLDISKDYNEIEKSMRDIEQEIGPIFILINCAGTAVCGKLEDTSPSDIEMMIRLNLLGSIYPTKAVLDNMKSQGAGHIVFVASQAAFLGIYGYSAYTSSKFGLRGLAEAIQMEVAAYGVKVTIAFPADTDTPGFAEEEKSKPKETRLISETSGLYSPDVVAEKILKDVLAGEFTSSVGFEGFMLSTLCCGMSPVASFTTLFIQFFLMGFFRLISYCYLISFQRIIKKCLQEKNDSKRAE